MLGGFVTRKEEKKNEKGEEKKLGKGETETKGSMGFCLLYCILFIIVLLLWGTYTLEYMEKPSGKGVLSGIMLVVLIVYQLAFLALLAAGAVSNLVSSSVGHLKKGSLLYRIDQFVCNFIGWGFWLFVGLGVVIYILIVEIEKW